MRTENGKDRLKVTTKYGMADAGTGEMYRRMYSRAVCRRNYDEIGNTDFKEFPRPHDERNGGKRWGTEKDYSHL